MKSGRKEMIKTEILKELEGRLQVEDEELRELIDRAVLDAGEKEFLPLKEKVRLKKELFDSFRRLDILQELVEETSITEIMVNGCENIFVEQNGRILQLEKRFESREQLEDLIQQSIRLVGKPAALMTKDDKLRAVRFLNDSGALLITKSGARICEVFDFSKYTLYNYLEEIKKQEEAEEKSEG